MWFRTNNTPILFGLNEYFFTNRVGFVVEFNVLTALVSKYLVSNMNCHNLEISAKLKFQCSAYDQILNKIKQNIRKLNES